MKRTFKYTTSYIVDTRLSMYAVDFPLSLKINFELFSSLRSGDKV